MTAEFTTFGLYNFYGCLETKKENGKYFWAIENWDGYDWKEIPKYLYDSLKKFEGEGQVANANIRRELFSNSDNHEMILESSAEQDAVFISLKNIDENSLEIHFNEYGMDLDQAMLFYNELGAIISEQISRRLLKGKTQ